MTASTRKSTHKALTVRLSPMLHKALATLSDVKKRTMNDLVNEAATRLVVAESSAVAAQLESTAAKLRSYIEQDPGFDKAIAQFAEAEAEHKDPTEGEVFEVESSVQKRVSELLTDA